MTISAMEAARAAVKVAQREGTQLEDVTITSHTSTASGEYRAHVAGSDHIGRLTWTEKDGARHAEHTLVPKEIGGRGVAAKLVDALVADAQAQGFKVKPVCSYVVKAFEKHPEWADLLA